MKSVVKEHNRMMKHLKYAGMKPSPRRSIAETGVSGYYMEKKFEIIAKKQGKSLRGHS